MSTLQQRRPTAPTTGSPNEKILQTNIGSSDTTPLVASNVIRTLLLFTAAMVICPIGSYFVTVNTIFRGNSTFAGGFAALVANVVLIGYVVVAWKDDVEDGSTKSNVGTGVRGPAEGKKEK
ncbi:vacuolar ATPase assembly integral membrane protein vma21 [Neophaeococcomyces mojaviensis]|uniref:Vacuolar ATPase assembly integral membrane protein vma21 n=1 Tax=Neophaeococcomyces mojaviensis TaxID=3383035 RepID=A0ACC3A8C6_9EURO|nr:vacuolar ATPase assembly integral membrane protein vma21 [Knufia sp. JES_112]